MVLKEGKHLSEREVENEKRKGQLIEHVFPQGSSAYRHPTAKGLPPLTDAEPDTKSPDEPKKTKEKSDARKGLSFSSSSGRPPAAGSKKRKTGALESADHDERDVKGTKKAKKPKKETKTLLSFGDGEE